MIVVPVAPTRIPKIPWSPRPTAPPCAEPSAASRPKVVTTRPVRNGLTSTSALRATISAPTTTKATGATYVAAPIVAMKPSAIQPPTIPPPHPRYRIEARKTPSATSPSPMSSGCCWFFGLPFAPLRTDTRGQARLEGALFLASRHAGCVRHRASASYAKSPCLTCSRPEARASLAGRRNDVDAAPRQWAEVVLRRPGLAGVPRTPYPTSRKRAFADLRPTGGPDHVDACREGPK